MLRIGLGSSPFARHYSGNLSRASLPLATALTHTDFTQTYTESSVLVRVQSASVRAVLNASETRMLISFPPATKMFQFAGFAP